MYESSFTKPTNMESAYKIKHYPHLSEFEFDTAILCLWEDLQMWQKSSDKTRPQSGLTSVRRYGEMEAMDQDAVRKFKVQSDET